MKSISICLFLVLIAGCTNKSSPDSIQKVSIRIDGMVCSSCEKSIQSKLAKVQGVISIIVSLEEKNAVIEYDSEKINVTELTHEINAIGYRASPTVLQ